MVEMSGKLMMAIGEGRWAGRYRNEGGGFFSL